MPYGGHLDSGKISEPGTGSGAGGRNAAEVHRRNDSISWGKRAFVLTLKPVVGYDAGIERPYWPRQVGDLLLEVLLRDATGAR
jgi:hypothetical protein